ncbi:Crp/Fnr family transcriptional regulator [Bifidobacterium simiarum]|nr:Crp/Fnr family transcriptional regulator [Bifidobacterium simiarum]
MEVRTLVIRESNTMEDQRNALLHTALFKQVRPEEADQLLPHLQRRYYAKGDTIFREGDTDHRIYLVENGRVKLTRESSDHRIHLLSITGRGELLGEIPVFDPTGGPRTASAIVMTNGTTVSSMERSAMFDWLDEHPRVAIDMLQVMANRARLNNERIGDLVFMDVPGRLAKTLIDLAQRFGEPSEDGLVVPHDLTQEEMAQLVGASRETVNKALMEFTQRGWISRKGRTIIIYQPGKLIRRAHQ